MLRRGKTPNIERLGHPKGWTPNDNAKSISTVMVTVSQAVGRLQELDLKPQKGSMLARVFSDRYFLFRFFGGQWNGIQNLAPADLFLVTILPKTAKNPQK